MTLPAVNSDELVKKSKSSLICHSRESGNPAITISYGFPIRSGMTKRQKLRLFAETVNFYSHIKNVESWT